MFMNKLLGIPNTSEKGVITLDNLPSGSKARIVEIRVASLNIADRLYQIGFVPGSIVEVVANYCKGPIIVKIHGCETAISRGIASKIIVEKID